MTTKHLFLFLISLTLTISCKDNIPQISTDTVEGIQVQVENLKSVKSDSENEFFQPISLVKALENSYAVLDVSLNKVILYDEEWNKKFSFGNTGDGPGEWSKGGPRNIDWMEGKFLVTDSNRYKIFIYDNEGKIDQEYEYLPKFRYTTKGFLSPNQVLMASNGYEDSFAVVANLENNGEIGDKIGESEDFQVQGGMLEPIREALANKEVPKVLQNEAITGNGPNGVTILLNSTGILKYYDTEFELQWESSLPKEVTNPIKEFVAQKNKDAKGSNTYYDLKYALRVKEHDNKIFILTNRTEEPAVNQYLLTYDIDGELINYLEFNDTKGRFLLSDFIVDKNKIYLSDIINSDIYYHVISDI